MNKQFLSVLLLTCFASTAYPSAIWKQAAYVAGGLGLSGAATHNIVTQKAANVAAEKAKTVVEAAPAVVEAVVEAALNPSNADTFAEIAQAEIVRQAQEASVAKVAAEHLRVAKQFGFDSVDAMNEYFANAPMNRSMMNELDAVNAKLWSQTPVLDKAKYYAGAAWNGTVAGAKSAYNATGSAATATAQWAKNHPGYAVAAVAGIAAAGYLAYTYWPSKSESMSAQDQVVVKAGLKANMTQLTKQCPGQGFYKDGDFNKLAHREFFTGTPASYGVSKDVLWYLNDAVTCAHALNYIQRNNVTVEASVKAKIQARLEKAQSKTAAVLAA